MQPMHFNSEWEVYDVLWLCYSYFVVLYEVKKCCMVRRFHGLLSLVHISHRSVHRIDPTLDPSLDPLMATYVLPVKTKLLTANYQINHQTLSGWVGPKRVALFGPRTKTGGNINVVAP